MASGLQGPLAEAMAMFYQVWMHMHYKPVVADSHMLPGTQHLLMASSILPCGLGMLTCGHGEASTYMKASPPLAGLPAYQGGPVQLAMGHDDAGPPAVVASLGSTTHS